MDPALGDTRARWMRPSARLVRIFHESWKYFLVSAMALAIDWGLLVGLTEWARLNYLISAAIGFCAGLVLNYLLSVALVFRERRLQSRWLEFLGFFVIGALGLGLNEILMKLFVETVGLGYALAKLPATGVGFLFNFGSRRLLLFTAPGKIHRGVADLGDDQTGHG
jgi:putative flippase GtrA